LDLRAVLPRRFCGYILGGLLLAEHIGELSVMVCRYEGKEEVLSYIDVEEGRRRMDAECACRGRCCQGTLALSVKSELGMCELTETVAK
jgi:hypothetical protein